MTDSDADTATNLKQRTRREKKSVLGMGERNKPKYTHSDPKKI
jgi:hypothetical protein